MKNLLLRFSKQNIQLFTRILIILVAFGFFGTSAFAQITSTTAATRCGAGTLVLQAAGSGTITWYSVPFYGTPLGTGTSFTTPTLEVTTTYYVDAIVDNCSVNSGNVRVPVIATISANSIQAAIFYVSNTFCNSVSTEQLPTRTGTAGGTYSYTGTGTLALNATTGAILPSSSTNGTYEVTYTVEPAAGCIENPASTTVTITTAPTAPAISYSGTPFCTTAGLINVTQTGVTGGIYSATPTGLTLNSSSGQITTATSYSGTYEVTYFVSGAGGCEPQTATTNVTILQLPTAAISYDGPFTQNQGSQPVNLSGTGVYTGGTYTQTGGAGTLSLDANSGAIDPSQSDAGTYTVTYTLAAVAPCAQVTATANISIYPLPSATISGTTDVCKNATQPEITFTGADGATPYTFIYKINDGVDLSVTTTSGNSVTVAQNTGTSGTFAYTLVSVTDGNGSYHAQTGTATITVNDQLVPLFTYAGSPYCNNGADASPTFIDGGQAGVFSSTAGLVFVSTATGVIDVSATTPGTYTVTNTIPLTLGCAEVSATASVTITRLPVATFSYPSSPYCATSGFASPTLNDAGEFTCDNPSLVFSNTSGSVDLVATPGGTYTITNTIVAANGCALVSATANITIQSAPVMTSTTTWSICSGTSTSIPLTSEPAATSFTWTIDQVTGGITGQSGGTSGAGTSISQVLTNPSNSANGTVRYLVTPTVSGAGECSVGSGYFITVTVRPTPQLSSSLTPPAICSGGTFAYTPTSNAGSPTFAWTRATVSGITEAGTTGVAGVSETLTNSTSSPIDVTYQYITTADGCSNTAQDVVVSVVADPTLSQPGNVSICLGGTTTLSTTASNGTGTFLYQWQYSANGTTGWANVADASPAGITYTGNTTTSLTITGDGLETAQANYYKCILSTNTPAGAGCNDETDAVTVTSVDLPLVSTQPLSTQTVCINGTPSDLTFAATGGTGNFSYQWYSNSSASLVEASLINEETNSTYTPPTSSTGTMYYYCIITQSGSGCGTLTSNFAEVIIRSQFTAGAISTTGETICYSGNPAEIGSSTASSGGDGAITYKWESSLDGFATAGSVIDGATSASYDPPTGLTATTSYRRYAHDGTCNTSFVASTGTWVVTVNPLPTITTTGTAAAVTISGSEQSTTLAYTATTNTPISYSIDWTGLADQTSTSITFQSGAGSVTGIIIPANTAAGVYSGTMTIANANGCTTTQAVSIQVNPLAPTGSSSQTFCSGN